MQPPNILLDNHGGALGGLCQQMNLLHHHIVSSWYCETTFICSPILNVFGVTSRKKVKCIEKFRTKSVTEIVEEFVSNVIVILTFSSAVSFQMSGQSLSGDNGNTMLTVRHNGCRARNKLSHSKHSYKHLQVLQTTLENNYGRWAPPHPQNWKCPSERKGQLTQLWRHRSILRV